VSKGLLFPSGEAPTNEVIDSLFPPPQHRLICALYRILPPQR
jgi:hypothetical protein